MTMAGRWVVGMLAFVLGCRTATQQGSVSPEPGPEAAAEPATTENQYVSGSADKPAEDEAAKPAEEEAPAAVAGIPAKVETIAAARALVEAVADGIVGAGFERIVSPALVKQWPTKEHVLIFVVYPLEASKAGINTFIVGAPTRVTVDLIEGTTKQEKLKRSVILDKIKLGRDAATVREHLEVAEQTLIDVLLERRPVERSLMLLDGYREWFNHHLDVMTDLDKRLPDAVRWLRRPNVDGHTAG